MEDSRSRPAARYPIRAVAGLTGVPVETLRAWERRHGVVAPRREGGNRTYGEADVRKLRLLRELVDAGHPIGRLAALGEEDLRALADVHHEAGARAPGADLRAIVDEIWGALERFEVETAQDRLERLAAWLPADVLCLDVALPLVKRVGEAWSEGRVGIAHEHLLSAAVRTVLGSTTRLLRPSRGAAAPRVVLAAPEGELHDLGLTAASLLAASQRLSPVYLGANVPAPDVIDAVRWTHARAVVLAVVTDRTPMDPLKGVDDIAGAVPRDVEVLVGGAATERLAAALEAGPARWIPDLEALSAELRRITAGS